jgi:hypothetical protein
VAHAPKRACQRSARKLALARHDGGNGNYMVRICSVAHPQKKTYRNDGKKTTHGLSNRIPF